MRGLCLFRRRGHGEGGLGHLEREGLTVSGSDGGLTAMKQEIYGTLREATGFERGVPRN